jgi:hypothetical protein
VISSNNRTLWKPLTSRATYILKGNVPLLRQYFLDQSFVCSPHCSCSECDELFEEPLELACRHTFCAQCIEDCEQCPTCGAEQQLDDDGRPQNAQPVSLLERLGAAVLTCPLGDCEWRGTMPEIKAHVESDCEYRPMQCPFYKCRAFLVRCQLPMHEKLCEKAKLGTKVEMRAQKAATRAAKGIPARAKKSTDDADDDDDDDGDDDLPPFGGVAQASPSPAARAQPVRSQVLYSATRAFVFVREMIVDGYARRIALGCSAAVSCRISRTASQTSSSPATSDVDYDGGARIVAATAIATATNSDSANID